jgi:hypothetical protein
MKKFYFLIVFFGALLFCACEKETIDPLMGDQAQTQLDDGTLKKANHRGNEHAVPFKARFSQEQTVFEEGPPVYVEMVGLGNATHLGKTNLWVGQTWGGVFPNLEGEAEVTFTAANGDNLYADLYAYNTIELVEVNGEWVPVFASITGAGTFTGGTGRFLNASGSYSMTGDFDFATGESNASYIGEIMY